MKHYFWSNQFTPTEWNTVEDKAKFANHFMRFIESGCPRSLFHEWFYQRLSMCFGMIAHYNIQGFYDTYFTNPEDIQRFLDECMTNGVYGDPKWTFVDVEKAIKEQFKYDYSIDQWVIVE